MEKSHPCHVPRYRSVSFIFSHRQLDAMARYTGRTCRLTIMLVLNVFCFLMELTVGFIYNSTVLTADAFNVLSDLIGVIIALICMKVSTKGPSERNTYGWARCNELGAFINALFMLALCFIIAIEVMKRFIQPEPVDQPRLVMIVGVAGLTTNLIGLFLLNDYRSIGPSDEGDKKRPSATNEVKNGSSSNRNMYGAYLHVVGDAAGSVIVIACALIEWQLPYVPFLQNYLDPILGTLVVIILTVTSVKLVKESSLLLLQAVPRSVNMAHLRASVLSKSSSVEKVNELHVWQLSSEKVVASVRIGFKDTASWGEISEIIDDVEKCFQEAGIHSVTVQPQQLPGFTVPPRYSQCNLRVKFPSIVAPPSSQNNNEMSIWM